MESVYYCKKCSIAFPSVTRYLKHRKLFCQLGRAPENLDKDLPEDGIGKLSLAEASIRVKRCLEQKMKEVDPEIYAVVDRVQEFKSRKKTDYKKINELRNDFLQKVSDLKSEAKELEANFNDKNRRYESIQAYQKISSLEISGTEELLEELHDLRKAIDFVDDEISTYINLLDQVENGNIGSLPSPTSPVPATPTTVKPSTVKPSTVKPSTVKPSRVKPSTVTTLPALPVCTPTPTPPPPPVTSLAPPPLVTPAMVSPAMVTMETKTPLTRQASSEERKRASRSSTQVSNVETRLTVERPSSSDSFILLGRLQRKKEILNLQKEIRDMENDERQGSVVQTITRDVLGDACQMSYEPESGIAIYLDYLTPTFHISANLVIAVIRRERVVSQCCTFVVSPSSHLTYLGYNDILPNLHPDDDLYLYSSVQTIQGEELGWCLFSLFHEGHLNSGAWRVPLKTPPFSCDLVSSLYHGVRSLNYSLRIRCSLPVLHDLLLAGPKPKLAQYKLHNPVFSDTLILDRTKKPAVPSREKTTSLERVAATYGPPGDFDPVKTARRSAKAPTPMRPMPPPPPPKPADEPKSALPAPIATPLIAPAPTAPSRVKGLHFHTLILPALVTTPTAAVPDKSDNSKSRADNSKSRADNSKSRADNTKSRPSETSLPDNRLHPENTVQYNSGITVHVKHCQIDEEMELIGAPSEDLPPSQHGYQTTMTNYHFFDYQTLELPWQPSDDLILFEFRDEKNEDNGAIGWTWSKYSDKEQMLEVFKPPVPSFQDLVKVLSDELENEDAHPKTTFPLLPESYFLVRYYDTTEPVPSFPVRHTSLANIPQPRLPTGAFRHVDPKPNFKVHDSKKSIILAIDGARYLPSCVTISRVTGRVFDRDFNTVGPQISTGLVLESDVYNPVYKYTVQLPGNVPKTTVVVFKMYSLHVASAQLMCVGYSVLNLFCVRGTNTAPTDDTESSVVLNEGPIQLPIHVDGPDASTTLTTDSIQDTYQIPCAWLLVRIMYKSGSVPPIPTYNDGVYCDTRPTLTDTEMYLLDSHRRRSIVTGKSVSPVAASGVVKKLTRHKGQTVLDMHSSDIVEYNPDFGFGVKILGVKNLDNCHYKTFVYLRLCTKDTIHKYTDHITYNESVQFCVENRIKWMDQVHYFKHVIPSHDVFILVQVLGHKDGSFVSIGWTTIPIFCSTSPVIFVNKSLRCEISLVTGPVSSLDIHTTDTELRSVLEVSDDQENRPFIVAQIFDSRFGSEVKNVAYAVNQDYEQLASDGVEFIAEEMRKYRSMDL